MSGVGVRTAVRLLTEVTGKSSRPAIHLPAYAGVAMVPRRPVARSEESPPHDAATGSSTCDVSLRIANRLVFSAVVAPWTRSYRVRNAAGEVSRIRVAATHKRSLGHLDRKVLLSRAAARLGDIAAAVP